MRNFWIRVRHWPGSIKFAWWDRARWEITWAQTTHGGRADVLDLTALIGSYKVYRRLRGNADLFATAHLVEDGEVVAWDAPDLEMTAELIETQSDRGADR